MKLVNTFAIKLLLLCFVLTLSCLKSYAQGFIWAKEIVSSINIGSSIGTCTTDGNNDAYFLGAFSGTADVDPGPGIQNLTAGGILDMYVLKTDPSGSFLWVKHVAGLNSSAYCGGIGIGLDSSGNIYVGGTFSGDLDFDPGPGVYQLSSYGGYHSFVLKLDPLGNFIWVKDMGNQVSAANMSLLCMKMDNAANIFFGCSINGITSNTIDVDPGPAVFNVICPTTGGNDILIEKLDSAGNFIWVKQISGPDDEDPYGLALDMASNVYITGQFKSTVDFDAGIGVSNLTATNNYDAFIAKYDSAGNYQWAGQISGNGEQVGNGIATDNFGGVIITGYCEGLVDFDPGTSVYNIATTDIDMFVLKLYSDGSFAWAKSVHPGGSDRGNAIATDPQGNVYTTGDFYSNADFDPGPGEYWLNDGVYVQKLDSGGNFIWAKAFGGTIPGAVVLDHANDIYVVGSFTAPGDFDPGPGVFTLIGGNAGFIEKLCGSSLAISASDSTPCPGDNVQLSTPAITGATYTWTMNGNVVGGNTNIITVSQPGVYEVYVDGGCPSASGPLYIIDCTGVGETLTAAAIKLYPNPSNDELTIETTLPNYKLTVVNTLGQITEQRAERESVVLDVSEYNSGVYYLRIETTDGQAMNRKFVVQH